MNTLTAPTAPETRETRSRPMTTATASKTPRTRTIQKFRIGDPVDVRLYGNWVPGRVIDVSDPGPWRWGMGSDADLRCTYTVRLSVTGAEAIRKVPDIRKSVPVFTDED